MKIPKEELNRYKTYVTHDKGYRIVYFYEIYHEAPYGLYAKELSDFNKMLDLPENADVDEILDVFLKRNKKAKGVAIYDVDANCIQKKVRKNVKKINNSEVYKEELIYDYDYVVADKGYRIVYFYPDNSYYIDSWSENVEGFMFHFCDSYPVWDEDDIPKFISVDDLLNRYLNDIPEISAVALYKVDGTCVKRKERNIKEN